MYIVDDVVQESPVLIGQSFINKNGKVLMVNQNEIRLFKAEEYLIPQVEALPPAKVSLCSEKDVSIPTNHIGYVKIYTPD